MTFVYAAMITYLLNVIVMLTLLCVHIVSCWCQSSVLSMFIVNEPLCVKTTHFVIDGCYVGMFVVHRSCICANVMSAVINVHDCMFWIVYYN